jgi:hypothetical protein
MAAVVVGIEALAMLGVAVWQETGVLGGQAAQPDVAVGTAAYFLLVGAVVAVVAAFLWRAARWAFGPAVFLQLLGLLLAGTMASAGLWTGALALGVLVAIGLVVLLSPAGRAAFGRV